MSTLKKVMLVENEQDIRDAAFICLKDLGDFDVTMCESGQVALDQFPSAQPQLILMDVMMPGMNGLTAYSELKRLPGGKDVPVIFVTARAHRSEIKQYMELGAAGVISKPFDPLSVISEITAIWQKFHESRP